MPLITAVMTAQAADQRPASSPALTRPRRTSPSSEASDATSTGTPGGAIGTSASAISAPARRRPCARPLAQLGDQQRDEERRIDRVEAQRLGSPSTAPPSTPTAVPSTQVDVLDRGEPNRKWRSKPPLPSDAIAHDASTTVCPCAARADRAARQRRRRARSPSAGSASSSAPPPRSPSRARRPRRGSPARRSAPSRRTRSPTSAMAASPACRRRAPARRTSAASSPPRWRTGRRRARRRGSPALMPPRGSACAARASSAHGRVFATCSGVSHARRAVAMPKRISSRLRTECASELTRISTPASAAARAWISLRSRRSGAALISSIVRVRAAASITRSMSISVRRARLDLAAGRMADRVDERMLDRGDHARRHVRLGHRERRVHGGDDPVQLGQQLVVVVERPSGRMFVSVPISSVKSSSSASSARTRSICARSASGCRRRCRSRARAEWSVIARYS